MSWQPCDDPKPGDSASCEAIEQIIIPRARDLGGFEVRRALPAKGRQMVGPFIFFDQMGPAEFLIGNGVDVRPHPHIGLATVTYLFAGELMHRDSLGTELAIKPGELNLMSAGRGIVHSERSSAETRAQGSRLFGLQAWAALPKAHEEDAPTFAHFDSTALPRITGEGKTVRLIMGALYGAHAPASFPHDCFYAEAVLAPGAVLPLDPDYDERAIYVVSGEIDIAGQRYGDGRLLVFRPGDRISILAMSMARIMLLGGEPMDGPRHIWWNFVSSSEDRIAAAKADWKARRFDPVPTDQEEFIPAPE
ncbi:MAG: pirin family protein [Rhizobiales bacterium]|nr:pirin family protein [Hyphomicrobiales bacterium]